MRVFFIVLISYLFYLESYTQVSRQDVISYTLDYYALKRNIDKKEVVKLESFQEVDKKELEKKSAKSLQKDQKGEKEGFLKGIFKNAHPYIRISEKFNDNIYNNSQDKISDFITIVNPGVEFKSIMGEKKIGLFLDSGVKIEKYANNSEYNTEDPYPYFSSSLNYGKRKTGFLIGVGAKKNRSTKSSITDVSSDIGFVDYWTYSYKSSFKLSLNRFEEELKYSRTETSYTEEEFYTQNSDIDEIALVSSIKLFSKTKLFLEYSHSWHNYSKDSSKDWYDNKYSIGLNGKIAPKLRGTMQFGYQTVEDKKNLGTNSTTINVGLNYLTSPRLSHTLKIIRGFKDANIEKESKTNYNQITLSTSYLPPFSKKLRLGATVGYRQNEYEESDRKDEIYSIGLTSEYKLKKWLKIGGGYKFTKKQSTEENSGYTNNIASLELVAEF